MWRCTTSPRLAAGRGSARGSRSPATSSSPDGGGTPSVHRWLMHFWSHLWDFYYRCFPVCLDCLLPHLPAANLNSPFMYLSEGNFREIFCIARGVSHTESDTTERLSLCLRQRLYTHSPLSAPTLLMLTGPLIWVMNTALQGEDHALQPPWLPGESVCLSSEGRRFILLGAFLKRGLSALSPLSPALFCWAEEVGGGQEMATEGSTTCCDCPGKTRPTPRAGGEGVKERGGTLATLEEERVGSLTTRGRRGCRRNLRCCSWHPVCGCSLPRQRTPTGSQADGEWSWAWKRGCLL